MDRQAFKQRMQNLKSYRENNPGKGYWDWKVEAFAEGGQTGDPEKERFYQATGRSSSGRPLEEGLKPVFSLEDAANMTPIGDAISAKDAYDAVKNRDWLGAGLAASAMIPFIPNVYRSLKSKISREVPTVTRSFQRQVDANDLRRDLENNNRRRVLEEYSDQRNRAYELLNTPEARRRAQNIDRKYGTEYNKVYDDLTKEYEDINSYVNLPEPNFVSNKKDYANIDPSKSKIINLLPSYKDGGIHIKKKNRGKFNALKKRTGKSTEELTHSKNPLTRKRAIFAQNAKKWKHKGRKK